MLGQQRWNICTLSQRGTFFSWSSILDCRLLLCSCVLVQARCWKTYASQAVLIHFTLSLLVLVSSCRALQQVLFCCGHRSRISMAEKLCICKCSDPSCEPLFISP